MSSTNRINYSVNISTSGNLIVGGSSSIGNLSASSGNISNLTSTNLTTNSLVGGSMNLSSELFASTATIPQLVATNVSAGSLVGSTARLDSSVTLGNLRVSGNVSSFTEGNLTIAPVITTIRKTNIGQLDTAPNTFYINSRGDVDLYGNINLMVNNSSGMSIYNPATPTSMNVGINNVSPLAPLHFANINASRKIVLSSDSNNDNQYLGLGTNTGTFRFQINNTSSNFVFYTGTSSTSSNELLRIRGSGNVGIGVTSPVSTLHLHKSSPSQDMRVVLTDGTTTDGNNRGLHLFKNESQNAYLYNYENGLLQLGTNNTTIMTLTPAGNVGLKTTTSNAPLQFSSTTVNRKIVLREIANNDNEFYGFGVNNTATLRYQVDSTSSSHLFYAGNSSTSSTELMRIRGNGNVGVGQSSLEFPPVAMSSTSSAVSDQIYGNGVYIATASSNWTQGYSFSPFKAFNKTTNADANDVWHSETLSYNTSTGAYTGEISTIVDGSPYLGEWLQIQLPTSIILRSYSLQNRTGFNQLAKTWRVVGSNDGSTWTTINSQTNITNIGIGASDIMSFSVNSTTAYSFFRIIGNVVNNNGGGGGYFVVGEWRLYGTDINYQINPSYTLDVSGTFDVSNSNGVLLFNTAGNVGVGATAPAYKLTVFNGENQNTSMLIASGNENNNSSLYLGTPFLGNLSGAQKTTIVAQALNTWSRSNLHFCLNNNGDSNAAAQNATLDHSRMTIFNTGNVGIGTTNPTQTLDVNGRVRVANTLGALINSVNFTNFRSPFLNGSTNTTFSNVGVYIGNTQDLTLNYDSNTGANPFPNSFFHWFATYTHNLNLSGGQHIELTLAGGGSAANGTQFALSSWNANSFTVFFHTMLFGGNGQDLAKLAKQFNYRIINYFN